MGCNSIIGSAEYIAPEQLRGKAVFASDFYSLGVTCIHLLTQASPFQLFSDSSDRWVWREYLVDNSISYSLGRILDKMIEKALDRRYQSTQQILQALNPSFQTVNDTVTSNSFCSNQSDNSVLVSTTGINYTELADLRINACYLHYNY